MTQGSLQLPQCSNQNYALEYMSYIWWPREVNALQIEKHMQIKKTTSSIWQHTRCKCSQHNQIKKHTTN